MTSLVTDFSSGIVCEWSGFPDPQSGIGGYMVGMGTFEGDDSLSAYTSLGPEHSHHTFTIHGKTLIII